MTECKGNAFTSKSEQTPEPLIEYFATCPKGFEQLLADELKRLRAKRVRPLKSGVAFFGSRVDGYRICLWSRIASRVLCVIDRVDASDADRLYQGVKALSWEQFVSGGGQATIAVTARGGNEALRNSQFIALKVKDAICDRLREVQGSRPDVSPYRPDVPIWVSVHKKKATISIDYAGESLHRRGYREAGETVEAPLKEALAAGMLVWGGWDRAAAPVLRRVEAKRKGVEAIDAPVFIDPTCGSGTLVLEAAMMATDRAPGLARDYWGFASCADFDVDAFDELLADADDRFEAGLANAPIMIGADIDQRAIEIACGNARRLGLSKIVQFIQADCACLAETLQKSGVTPDQKGFIACNPPYGVRLLNSGELALFYTKLAQGLQSLSESWRMLAITPDSMFDSAIGFDAQRTLAVYNGALEVTLRDFTLGSSFVTELSLLTLSGKEVPIQTSSGHAEQFAARLRKMAKARKKWAKKQNINAYRVYDADLPDYAVAVDVFEGVPLSEYEKSRSDKSSQESLQNDKNSQEGKNNRSNEKGQDGRVCPQLFVLVTEYQAPKEIDPQKAARRFKDVCKVAQALFEVPEERLFTRVRRQDKGGSQYRKDSHASHAIIVKEEGLPFELDLSGYLDTGLFLDHRITRHMVGKMAEGKSFLNLFAYTGAATVHAAACGAKQTTTVDMSQTYLEWARRNMIRSGFTGGNHRFVRADVLSWVEKEAARCLVSKGDDLLDDSSHAASSDTSSTTSVRTSDSAAGYDLIFLDPPTFSNSKTMGKRTWDIQRDHAELLSKVRQLLNPGGCIVFSGNLRSFKLDEQAISTLKLSIENITAQTIPEDFSRNPRIHFCYILRDTV